MDIDVFSTHGAVGAGAGISAFLLVRGLINHFEKLGTLSKLDINAIIGAALTSVPPGDNATKNDVRSLLANVRR